MSAITAASHKLYRSGFTLIEVVLALGVFLVSVVALVGLLAPMLESVDEIEKMDEITSVVNTVDAFLQGSPDIAVRSGGTTGPITKTKFNAIYEAVAGEGEATLFVYRYYDSSGAGNEEIRLEVGFSPAEEGIVGPNSVVNQGGANPPNFGLAAGPIYRVVLSASPVIPEALRSGRNGDGIYTLNQTVDNYPEGSLAMEARIFAEPPPGPGNGDAFVTDTDLVVLNDTEPDFTFNTAIVR